MKPAPKRPAQASLLPWRAGQLAQAIHVCRSAMQRPDDKEFTDDQFGGENMMEILPISEVAAGPWLNITPVANFLVRAGNVMVDGGFRLYQDGWRCRMSELLDLDGVRRNFDFPDTILLSEDHDTILDKLSWCSIEGPGTRPDD